MQLEFFFGPLDGHRCEFPPKKVPKQVVFCISGGKGWSPFFATYDYLPMQKRFAYAGWSLTDPEVVFRDDCIARPFVEFSDGRKLTVWRTVSDLKNANGGE